MLILIGTGGHAKVVFEAMVGVGVDTSTIFPRDGQSGKAGTKFMGNSVLTPEYPDNMDETEIHVAIGDNATRAMLFAKARDLGGTWRTVIHRGADISPSAVIGHGCFIASGAVLAAAANIGGGTIINHNSVVDHDCLIGEFCHIAPGAILGGQVSVGDRTLIGSGAIVLPGLTIGHDTMVGAGSVVTKSIGNSQTWIGTSIAS